MPLSFVEIRFLVLLIITLHLIVIVYTVSYVRMKNKDRIFAYMGLFMIMFIIDMFIVVGISGLQIPEDFRLFIERSQTGIGYAFIFALGALLFLISSAYRKESAELQWYSILANHVTVFFIGITFVVDLLPITKSIDFPFLHLIEVGITIAIGVLIDLVRRKGKE